MSREAQDRAIEGTTYRVKPIAAGIGMKVQLRLAKVGAPALLTLLASPPAAKGAWFAALPSIVRMFDLLSEEDVDYLCKSFANESQFGDGAKMLPLGPAFDEHFRGSYVALFQWFRFCMEVNFGPLWTWGKGLIPAAPDTEGSAKG